MVRPFEYEEGDEQDARAGDGQNADIGRQVRIMGSRFFPVSRGSFEGHCNGAHAIATADRFEDVRVCRRNDCNS